MVHDQGENANFAPPMLRPERSKLIVLEGIDLSGRTTQVQLLLDWLLAQRYHVTTTAWRTSPLISDVLTRARTGPALRPLTYSLLFCADHMDRTQQIIKPALERGEIVLADRYTYTAFARDAARGLDPTWIRNLYRFSIQPDIVFYLHISPEEAVKRRLTLQQRRESSLNAGSRKNGKDGKDAKDKKDSKSARDTKEDKQNRQQEKGASQTSKLMLSTPLSKEALESFRNFEIKMYSEYEEMQKEFGFSVIEGSQSIDQIQAILRRAMTRLLLDMG